MAKLESLGIKRVENVHFFVRDLERSRDHYLQRLDFAETAASTPEYEAEHHERAILLEAGDVRFQFSEPLGVKGEGYRFLAKHPEGVGRLTFEVEDVDRTFALLDERRATPTSQVRTVEGEDGKLRMFDITTAFGSTLFRFVQREGLSDPLPGLKRHATPTGGKNRFGIGVVDHITSNFLTLAPALLWMEHVLGWEPYWGVEFHTNDVRQSVSHGSGLKSTVMWDPHSGIKFANNEPAEPFFEASQIYLFCEDHRGAGVQHVALHVEDIIGTVRAMREAGVDFMPTPGTYYDMLPQRLVDLGVNEIEEDQSILRELEILVDGDADKSYMLQIFMKEAAGLFHDPGAGPLFIEIIQRKGDKGFGAGNFRALFESIERQQQAEGRI